MVGPVFYKCNLMYPPSIPAKLPGSRGAIPIRMRNEVVEKKGLRLSKLTETPLRSSRQEPQLGQPSDEVGASCVSARLDITHGRSPHVTPLDLPVGQQSGGRKVSQQNLFHFLPQTESLYKYQPQQLLLSPLFSLLLPSPSS